MGSINTLLTDPAIGLMILLGVGCAGFFFLQPILAGENDALRRINALKKTPVIQRKSRRALTSDERRRQMIAEGLRQIQREEKNDPDSIEVILRQSGLNWSRRQYLIYSLLLGLVCGVVFTLFIGNVYLGIIAVAVAAWIPPKMFIKFKRGRRFNAFTNELPNALDQIVRGVKAGLHTNECFLQIAQESKDPVKGEFAIVCDAQSLGMPTPEAIQAMAERIPTPETKFLAIAIGLQASSGGRLSEAIGNLSGTLRGRKQLKGDVAAMSQEVKVSTAIIGGMPIVFIIMMTFTSPDYLKPLFTTTMGILTLGGAASWMALGLFIIARMSQIKV